MGIVSTSTADQREDAQIDALQKAAAESGFAVLPMPVERTQDAQIQAIRALLVYRVDIIVFTPVVESGWAHILREAQAASIPLIAMDKSMQAAPDGAPVQYVGFDYSALAEQAVQRLAARGTASKEIIELYGTLNSYDAREIAHGIRAYLDRGGKKITYSLCGDGMRARGYEIAESLHEHLDQVAYIISHNDAMALGALDFLKTTGAVPGEDIYLCAFGGGTDTEHLFQQGEIEVLVKLDDQALARAVMTAAQTLLDNPQAHISSIVPAQVLEREG